MYLQEMNVGSPRCPFFRVCSWGGFARGGEVSAVACMGRRSQFNPTNSLLSSEPHLSVDLEPPGEFLGRQVVRALLPDILTLRLLWGQELALVVYRAQRC